MMMSKAHGERAFAITPSANFIIEASTPGYGPISLSIRFRFHRSESDLRHGCEAA